MSSQARAHIFLSGLVQGVGMRYFVYLQAKKMGLLGFVRNLSDGRVEIVAEGPRGQLEMLLRILKQSPVGRISHVETSWGPAGGEFTDFTIRR